MLYPKKCARCGYCCLAVLCPAGAEYYGQVSPCPGLRFNREGRAKCALVKKGMVPVGDGCCIKARAYKDGVEYNFASLPNNLKRRAVADLRKKMEV